jgi:hypothetical protein
MCACEGLYVCSRCRDTPADPTYADQVPEENVPLEGHRSDSLTTEWLRR